MSYGCDIVSGNLSKSAPFEGGVSYFERKFQTEGASATNHCWCQKTRVIALSCGFKTSALHCLLLSQSKLWQTDRQNYDSQERASIPASHGKNWIKRSVISTWGGSGSVANYWVRLRDSSKLTYRQKPSTVNCHTSDMIWTGHLILSNVTWQDFD